MGTVVAALPRVAAAPTLPLRVVGVSLRCVLHRAQFALRASRSEGLLAKALEAACCRLVGRWLRYRARRACSISAMHMHGGLLARAPG